MYFIWFQPNRRTEEEKIFIHTKDVRVLVLRMTKQGKGQQKPKGLRDTLCQG